MLTKSEMRREGVTPLIHDKYVLSRFNSSQISKKLGNKTYEDILCTYRYFKNNFSPLELPFYVSGNSICIEHVNGNSLFT